jgi:hypothetical protein
MGRRERPIDRSAGPVQAFADDLRILRTEAGSPAYAALARRTGYGVSTLADAASGRRLPSLEVTLAYVTACGGDPTAWEHRWRAVSLATRPAADPAPAAGQDPPDNPGQSPDQGGHADGGEPLGRAGRAGGGGRGGEGGRAGGGAAGGRAGGGARRLAVAAAAGAAGVVLVGGGLLAAVRDDDPDPAAPAASGTAATTPPGCPPAGAGSFGGTTFEQGVQVRAGAGVSRPVRGRLPGGCPVRFTGWCVGETVVDVFEGYPDARWYVLPDGGLLASAVVLGVPPAGLPPVSCPGGRPPAAVTRVTVVAGTATAAGRDAGTVGFAARFRKAGESAPAWHQVGVDEDPRDGSTARLPAAAAGAPVLAAPCYAPNWPAAGTAATAATGDRDRAAQAACAPWH